MNPAPPIPPRRTQDIHLDSGLTEGTKYFYSLFTYDAARNYSNGVFASATFIFKPFTVIALPDTQYLTLDYPALLTTQTQWILDNAAAKNIAFVLHEGDMTHTNIEQSWINASNSFAVLDGKVPYAIVPGNHDMIGGTTALLNKYFPVSKFKDLPTFGGVFQADKMNNSYRFFSAGGTDWLVVALEYNPSDELLDWASQIVAANPGRRVIVLTHAYLAPDDKRSGTGENIWNKLVRKYRNISFVFNGHYTDDEAARLVSDGDNGNKIYQMFADYQTLNFGGTGYLRIVELDRSRHKVSVKTYTPWLDTYKTDDANQFEFMDVDLSPPQ